MENISKTFAGDVQANKNITLRIEEGEVHGLLGENGAGKSTLMNILYGLISKDSGRIIIRGQEVEFHGPHDAISVGVGMVHQHFKLIPPLTVTENVVLGMEPIINGVDKRKGRLWKIVKQILPISYRSASKRIAAIAEENGMAIDPNAKIRDLSVGLQQRVEIIKTLYREADILILDEPTSVLTPQEVDELFVTLQKFKDAGKTIILITHKLREPIILCDKISVLRDGELVGTVNRADTSPSELAKMMVGREVVFSVEKEPAQPGNVVLQINNLHVRDSRGLDVVNGVSLNVRSGEIYGIAGVEGNGQTELVEAITGLRRATSGEITVNGTDITGMNPRQVRDVGVSHIPEDRHARGLILSFSIAENVVLGKHQNPPFATGPKNMMLDLDRFNKEAKNLVHTYSIKVSDVQVPVSTLSGGNQQKVVVARELSINPDLVIAAQPTRGLDVGATEFIHNTLIAMRDKGIAILLVSAELDEIRNLADRIGVIFDGKLVAEKDPYETSQEELGLLMAGHGSEDLEEARNV